jgi:hypothetical protein
MRIWLDDHIHDYHYNFTHTDDYWHYVAISYQRLFERETYMYVFIDNVLALETEIFDFYDYSPRSDVRFIIGEDFPGVIRKVKMNAKSYCLTETSEWIETDGTNCV